MPDPRVIQRVVLNLLRRCEACSGALLDDDRHADSGRTDCGFDPERKTR